MLPRGNLLGSSTRLRRSVGRLASSFLPLLHTRYLLANAVCAFFPAFWGGTVRARLYRLAGFDIGRGVSIWGNLHLTGGLPGFYRKLSVGEGTLISTDVTINLDASVSIGSNVTIGPRVLVYTANHRAGPARQRCLAAVVAKPVRIGDGCWIRLGAIVLPGVTIGEGSIVGAGVVVARDVPPNSFVEGSPAQIVRTLPSDGW